MLFMESNWLSSSAPRAAGRRGYSFCSPDRLPLQLPKRQICSTSFCARWWANGTVIERLVSR